MKLFWMGVGLITIVGCSGALERKVESTSSDSTPGPVTRTTVAAAADLMFAFEEIRTEFERRNPAIQVQVTFGSSGNFFAQLSHRAPFDLFLSADIDYPRRLIEQGRGMSDSEFSYAIGQIVIWVSKESTLAIESRGLEALTDPSVRRIAIANPKHAPYGRAALSALRYFDLYDQVVERLVPGESVAQACQFVESGAADVGILARSLAMSPSMQEKGRFVEIPAEAYPPIVQGGVVLSGARNEQAARQLRAFLLEAEGREILQRFGFQPPGE